MPRTEKENERIRQIAIEKIQNAAMELFIKKGYHTTSTNDIAKNAGVSKGLLYNYFKGKEALLAAMTEARIQEVNQVMETAVAQEKPALQLQYIIEGAIDNVFQNPKIFRFFLHLQTQPEADEVIAPYGKLLVDENAKQFQLQCKIFDRLGVEEPIKRSLYFSSTLQGIMLMISTYPKQFPIDEIKTQMIQEFCKDND